MTTQLSMPTEAIECPLCLGEGRLKRTEVLDRLGVKDFARVAVRQVVASAFTFNLFSVFMRPLRNWREFYSGSVKIGLDSTPRVCGVVSRSQQCAEQAATRHPNSNLQATPIEPQCPVVVVHVYGRYAGHKGCQHL
jgi:hypothetical protein